MGGAGCVGCVKKFSCKSLLKIRDDISRIMTFGFVKSIELITISCVRAFYMASRQDCKFVGFRAATEIDLERSLNNSIFNRKIAL